ncbi:MAG: PHP domain-containing protein [Gammaproteobacteria bacterium]|nr:PHP domain-containing protein [Gammaproteobacteria bacterium]MDH3406297.1 PHP domain-containing protein [Gammaproteobacteria bacterium]MDH3562104.1 PHP domain-containing protein [Gammaproteobacteria bacterium]MDH5486091.1 PHP domain-containing protein [Gammaproteobacteria bacterium]
MRISNIVPDSGHAKRYDLHSHSLFSDGTLTPSELVRRAHAAGVEVLALTDHDVTDGLDEAQTAAGQCGISVIAGVEISVTWKNQTLHIVGLNIDPDHSGLQQGLARLRKFREWRAEEIGRRLEKKKIDGAYAGAARLAKGTIIARTHFARFLVEQGYVRGFSQAFRQFLSRGKPGFVPGQWATLEEAVQWIVTAGGQAAVAHPARYKLSAGKMHQMLSEFHDCGGEAIEVVSGSHTPEANLHFAGISREYKFLASAGSDYHGPEQTWMDLGKLPSLPEGCTPVWRDWTQYENTARQALA